MGAKSSCRGRCRSRRMTFFLSLLSEVTWKITLRVSDENDTRVFEITAPLLHEQINQARMSKKTSQRDKKTETAGIAIKKCRDGSSEKDATSCCVEETLPQSFAVDDCFPLS